MKTLPEVELRLVVGGARGSHETFGMSAEDDRGLANLYAYSTADAAERPDECFVRGNMIATIDGAAVGADGHSRSIGVREDRRIFGILRSLCDVVLVGGGTARAEEYAPPVVRSSLVDRRALLRQGAHAEVAVITRTGKLPATLPHSGSRPPLLITAECDAVSVRREVRDAGGDDDNIIVAGIDTVDLGRALTALAERGLFRVQCEGGPRLLADVMAADLLDELCVTTAFATRGGDAVRIAAGAESNRDYALEHLLIGPTGSLARYSTARSMSVHEG